MSTELIINRLDQQEAIDSLLSANKTITIYEIITFTNSNSGAVEIPPGSTIKTDHYGTNNRAILSETFGGIPSFVTPSVQGQAITAQVDTSGNITLSENYTGNLAVFYGLKISTKDYSELSVSVIDRIIDTIENSTIKSEEVAVNESELNYTSSNDLQGVLKSIETSFDQQTLSINTLQQDIENQIDIVKDSKVDKDFLGWVQFSDTEYTQASPLSVLSDSRTLLPNNAGNVLNIVNPFGGNDWISNNKFNPDNFGDSYDWRVGFTIDPTLNNRNLTLELDIGGSQGVIWSKTIRLARGAGVDTRVTEQIDVYTLQTFIDNGGELYVTVDGESNIYDISYKIERKFRYLPKGLTLPSGALVVLTPESAYNSSGNIAEAGESVSEWRNLILGNGTPAAIQVGTDDLPIVQEDPIHGKQIQFTGGSCKLGFGITPELDFPQPTTDYTIICVCGTSNSNRTYWWSNNRGAGHPSGYSGFDTFGDRYYYYDGAGFTSSARPTPLTPSMVTVQRENSTNQTRVYDNQNLLYTATRSINKTATPDTNFILGGHYASDGVTNEFELVGSLKYFMVWKRVLSQQEITDVYNQII